MTTEVQAPILTEARRKSDTENARTVAARFVWGFDHDDQLVDGAGNVIAYTLEDAAAAMVALGWIMPNWRTDWNAMPNDGNEAADELRKLMKPNDHGRAIYPPRWA